MTGAGFSLRKRLRNAQALLLTSVLLLLWIFDHFTLRHLAEVFVRADLEHDIETVAAAWSPDTGLDFARLPPVYGDDRSGHYFVLNVRDREYRSGGLAQRALMPIPNAGLSGASERRTGPHGEELLVFARDVRAPTGELLSLIVAEPMGHINDALGSVMLIQVGVALTALVIFMILGRLMLNWALASLATLRESIAQMRRGDLVELQPDSVPTEISPLIEEVLRLQAATESRLTRARNMVDDLAHGLKTPLIAIQRMIDTAEMVDSRSLRELRDRMQRQIDHAVGRGRLAGDVAPGRQSRPGQDLPDLIELMRRAHGDRIELTASPLPDVAIDVDREDLLEFMGNLLDNACKWAESRVRLSMNLSDDHVFLIVEDDGQGFQPGQETLARYRGIRGDMTVPGQGLGLAMVAEGVDLYGGSLTIDRSNALGGARVTLGFRRGGD